MVWEHECLWDGHTNNEIKWSDEFKITVWYT